MSNSTQQVETIPVTVQPAPTAGWQVAAYNEVRNGAWAVLLVGAIAYTALRGVVAKYLEKHMSLLGTMEASLKQNATSLSDLARTEQDQTTALKHQGEALQKQGEAIQAQQKAILNIDQRQKEGVLKALDLIENTSKSIAVLAADRDRDTDEHQAITLRLAELRNLSEHHQQELIQKLQTIEDLYHAAEEVTGKKANIMNFWNR